MLPDDQMTKLYKSVAAKVFPGDGFFGCSDSFRAEIAVGGMIDEVHIFLDCPNSQHINIGELSFFNADGMELPREGLGATVEMSSIFKNRLECGPDAFVSGRSLYTKRDKYPWISIRLARPVYISRLALRNRDGKRRSRSRGLRIEACLNDRTVTFWQAGDAASGSLLQRVLDWFAAPLLLSSGLRRSVKKSRKRTIYCQSGKAARETLLKELLDQMDLIVQPNVSAEQNARNIRQEVARLIQAGNFDWSQREVVKMLPLHSSNPSIDEVDITLAAWIVCKILGVREEMETGELRDLSGVLRTPEALVNLAKRGSDILHAQGDTDAHLVLSKHKISRHPILLQHKEAYLSALDAVFPLFQEMGKQATLCYGSLLGAVRHKGFIPHDDDVDILYFDGASSYSEALANRDELIRRLATSGYKSTTCAGGNFHLWIKGVEIDLFPCWKSGENLNLLMENYQYRAIPFDSVFPASQFVSLYGRAYPAPADPEAFLARRYGLGWIKANPWHEWPWRLST